jgi:hypothetical protein
LAFFLGNRYDVHAAHLRAGNLAVTFGGEYRVVAKVLVRKETDKCDSASARAWRWPLALPSQAA